MALGGYLADRRNSPPQRSWPATAAGPLRLPPRPPWLLAVGVGHWPWRCSARGLDRSPTGRFSCSRRALRPRSCGASRIAGADCLRVSEACGTNAEDFGSERGHPTLRIVGKGNKPAVVPLVPRTARPSTLSFGNATRDRSFAAVTASVSTGAPPPLDPLPRRLRHGRARCRRPPPQRPGRRPSRRPTHDDYL